MFEKKLSAQNLKELQELTRLVNGEKFKLIQIIGNTALIPNGTQMARQQEAITSLLENQKAQWTGTILAGMGYAPNEKVSIDLITGKIKNVESTNSEKVA